MHRKQLTILEETRRAKYSLWKDDRNKITEPEANNFPNDDEFMMETTDNNDFQSNAEFAKEEENAIPWIDVEYNNTPFKVLEMNEVTTANGKAMIVKLQKRDNTTMDNKHNKRKSFEKASV